MIYIDPPYNTGNDFIYKDNFHESISSYLEQTGQSKDGIRLTTNPETSGRFHSDWVSFMYARLYVARNLLTDDGVIFVSIDDNEVHNLRLIMNEIFGEENYRNCIIIKRGTSNIQSQFSTVQKIKGGYESILFYTKNSDSKLPKPIKDDKKKIGMWNNHWRGTDRPTLRYELFGIMPDSGTWRWSQERSLKAIQSYKQMVLELKKSKTDISQQSIDNWYIKKIKELQCEKIDLLRLSDNGKPEHFVPPNRSELLTDVWLDINSNGSRKLKSFLPEINFDHPKSIDLLKRILDIISDKNAIILDFFAGSGTTAHAVLELNKEDGGNRKFITIQIPEKTNSKKYPTIADICKERIKRVIKKLDDGKNTDLGFKVFKLAKSNYKIWSEPKEHDDLKSQIKLFESPLIEKYRDEDVIHECIIKEGYSLNSKIEKMNLKSNNVYKITDDDKSFYICLDKSIMDNIIEETQITDVDILICMDAVLDDSQKTNLSKQCSLKTL